MGADRTARRRAHCRPAVALALWALACHPVDDRQYWTGSDWLRALRHGDSELRSMAAQTLPELPELPPGAAAALTRALADPNAEVRVSATTALISLGPRAPGLAQGVRVVLQASRFTPARAAAARVLGGLGGAAAQAVPALVAAAGDPSAELRRTALGALGAIRVSSPEVEDAALRATADADADVRVTAVAALQELGEREPGTAEWTRPSPGCSPPTRAARFRDPVPFPEPPP